MPETNIPQGPFFCGDFPRGTHGRKNEITPRDEGEAKGSPVPVRAARPASGKWIAVINRGNHTESFCLDISMKFRSKVKKCFSHHAPKCRNKQEKTSFSYWFIFLMCQSSTEPQVWNINDSLSGLGSTAGPQSPLSTRASNTRTGEETGLCLPSLAEHVCRWIPSFQIQEWLTSPQVSLLAHSKLLCCLTRTISMLS